MPITADGYLHSFERVPRSVFILFATNFDAWVHQCINKIEQEHSQCQEISVDDGGTDNDGNVIKTNCLIQRPPEARPQEDCFCDRGTRPQTDDEQSEVCNDVWQSGTQHVAPLHIARRQSFCLCHLYIVFARINEEKCSVAINTQEE